METELNKFSKSFAQNQFGTKAKLVATPAARVPALNNVSNNIAKTGDVRLRVAAGIRDAAQVTSMKSSKKNLIRLSNKKHFVCFVTGHPSTKPKTAAPLMQKSLQFFKSRFKR